MTDSRTDPALGMAPDAETAAAALFLLVDDGLAEAAEASRQGVLAVLRKRTGAAKCTPGLANRMNDSQYKPRPCRPRHV
jgi:hypothetical protein